MTDLQILGIIEKHIAELEAQIEKMKCCGNCVFEYRKSTENREKCWRCRHESKVFTEWELDIGIKETEKND